MDQFNSFYWIIKRLIVIPTWTVSLAMTGSWSTTLLIASLRTAGSDVTSAVVGFVATIGVAVVTLRWVFGLLLTTGLSTVTLGGRDVTGLTTSSDAGLFLVTGVATVTTGISTLTAFFVSLATVGRPRNFPVHSWNNVYLQINNFHFMFYFFAQSVNIKLAWLQAAQLCLRLWENQKCCTSARDLN